MLLAVELQQNNRLMQAEAVSAILETRMLQNEELQSNESLAEVYAKNIRREPLTDAETIRLRAGYVRIFQGYQRDYFLFQEGILDEEYLRTNIPTMKFLFSQPDVSYSRREFWELWKDLAPADYRVCIARSAID